MSDTKNPVRLGIIGLGGMGAYHAAYIRGGKITRCQLTAVSDVDPAKLQAYSDLATFTDSAALIRSGKVDAVLIATPHYFHTTTGIDALQNGLHVLVEKPISVHKADCERLIAARTGTRQVFAAMFNQRTVPVFLKMKQLIDQGELGELVRICWIVTDWFRTEAYYASSAWRATWKGEGGGVLLNQCPHQLDLLQWFGGMPVRVHGFCGFGVRHNIEVEDQVTAYLEYGNKATGVFIAATGEAPGANRLEIAGERGRAMIENGRLFFTRNEVPMTEFSRIATAGFARPDIWNVEIPVAAPGALHETVTQNFIDAILDGSPLIAPAEEGINSVELANAMLYSTLIDRTVTLPLDGAAFELAMKELVAKSTFVKAAPRKMVDMSLATSFQKIT